MNIRSVTRCMADASAIDAVQKGCEKSPKKKQKFGQAEVLAQSVDSSGAVTRGVSGSPVAEQLEGVPECSHRAGLVAAVQSEW